MQGPTKPMPPPAWCAATCVCAHGVIGIRHSRAERGGSDSGVRRAKEHDHGETDQALLAELHRRQLGRWRGRHAHHRDRPRAGEPIAEVARGTPADIDRAVPRGAGLLRQPRAARRAPAPARRSDA